MNNILNNITNIITSLPWRLTGPILDKELRVASRRKRTYILRAGYITLLLVFMLWVWWITVEMFSRYGGSNSNVVQISRLPEAGKMIVATIVWFQFIASQLIAMSLMSTAVGDEIRKRTLGILLTTPVTSLQIVIGKLIGGLCRVLILLAVSIPLLALVRVFGGVQWDYICSSLAITLAAVIFTGAVSLFYSITQKRSHHVISKIIGIFVFVYIFIPWGLAAFWMFKHLPNPLLLNSVIAYTNPFWALALNTRQSMNPGFSSMFNYSWPLHCLIELVAATIVILLAAWRVRTAGKKHINGDIPQLSFTKRILRIKDSFAPRKIRPVSNWPIYWKEIKAPLDHKNNLTHRLTNIVAAVALIVIYGIAFYENWFTATEYHITMIVGYIAIGFLAAASFAAASITSEKEAQTWTTLLLTPMENWQIALQKALGAARRTLPVWIIVFGHLIIFIVLKCIHWSALLHIPIIIAGGLMYFVASGMCFSAWTKKSSTAFILTFGLALAVGLFLPIFLGIAGSDVVELAVSANPLVQAGVIMEATAGEKNADNWWRELRYDWPIRSTNANFLNTTFGLFGSTLLYAITAFAFFTAATAAIRKQYLEPLSQLPVDPDSK